MIAPPRPALSAALAGTTIVIAVDRRASELTAALERHGAQVRRAPALTIVPHIDDAALIEATRALIDEPPRHCGGHDRRGISWMDGDRRRNGHAR